MARRGSVILSAVVEQQIQFDNESSFNEFLYQLDYYEEPYKVVNKTYIDGYLVVVIRKRYGEYPFLGDIDPSTLSETSKMIRDMSRGATLSEDGVLEITDYDKYRDWQRSASRWSRYY